MMNVGSRRWRAVFLPPLLFVAGRCAVGAAADEASDETPRPNFVVCITDDQGWGDIGYNSGHPKLLTPTLDEMARSGIRFDRFYAAHPVCSPTRGSVVTGRNPCRYGLFLYNMGIRPEELTIAEVLQRAGYATGHFGKWHMGPVKAGTPINPGGCGFDVWVSHDNWFDINPSLSRNGRPPEEHKGESSEVVAKAAMEFIGEQAATGKPFFAYVCFASPHGPYEALSKDRQPYRDQPEEAQHFLGEITALDRAMGMIRSELREAGVAENTLVWFCSDNGASGPGSTNGLKGRKGSVWEGGIRVPGILEWPARVTKPFVTAAPACTSDIYPTVVDLLDLDVSDQVTPLDGVSLAPVIDRKSSRRPEPIGFWWYPSGAERKNPLYLTEEVTKGWWRNFPNYTHPVPKTEDFGGHAALVDNRFKLHKKGKQLMLFDLIEDPEESQDIAGSRPAVVAEMKPKLDAWQASVERSLAGEDY
jgi:arylsulfatase A-like enzyme